MQWTRLFRKRVSSPIRVARAIGGHGYLSTRDAIPTTAGAVADLAQHTGAMVIRDPRLTRARTLSDQSGVGLNATFVFPTVCGGRDTAV
jgi:hypothetical protein